MILRTAVDIAAYEVRIVALHCRCVENVPCEDGVPEARREAFHLTLDAIGDVVARAIRHMAVAPGSVSAARRTRVIEKARLGQENEWPVRDLVSPRRALGSSCRCGVGRPLTIAGTGDSLITMHVAHSRDPGFRG